MPGGGFSCEYDFDETKPAGDTKGYDADNYMRSNQQHIDNAYAIEHYSMSNDPDESEDDFGRHDFITLKEQTTKPDLTGSSNRHAFYAMSGGLYYEFDDGTEIQIADSSTLKSAIPSGTKMLFYQDTAPTGWTVDSTPSDVVVACKGGSYYTAGGAIAGDTWGSGAGHTHTYTAVIAHTHTVPHGTSTGSGGIDGAARAASATVTTGSTGSASASTASANGLPSTWRPRAAVCIVATKD